MNTKAACITASFLIITGISLIFLFRPHPFSTWKKYRVLAVEKPVSPENIVNLLEASDIPVISRMSAHTSPISEFAPVQPGNSDYLVRTAHYFSDSEGKYELFYLSEERGLEKKLSAILISFADRWILDGGVKNSLWPGIIFFAFCMFLLIICPQKDFILAVSLPFVFFCFIAPDFFIIAGSCFALAVFFTASKFWYRITTIREVMLYPPLLFFICCMFFCFAIGGPIQGIACFTVSLSFLYLWFHVKAFLLKKAIRNEEHNIFCPVPLFPARCFPDELIVFLKMTISLSICLIGLAVFFILPSRFFSASVSNGLSIPAPTGYTNHVSFNAAGFVNFRQKHMTENLVDFSDYLRFQWQVRSFPYRTIYSEKSGGERENSPGDSVSITRYRADESGVIHQQQEKIMSFDDNFIKTVLEETLTGRISLEKMLAEQGYFVSVYFSGPVFNRKIPVFSLIFILVLPAAGVLVYKGSRDGRIIQHKKRRPENTAYRSPVH